MTPKRHVGTWSLVAVLLGPLVVVGCKEEDQCLPILYADERPWRLFVTDLESLSPAGLRVDGWLIHATELGCSGYASKRVPHQARFELDWVQTLATVTAHQRFDSYADAVEAGELPADPGDGTRWLSSQPDLDVRIPTYPAEYGTAWLTAPNPDEYGTGIFRMEPEADGRVFGVLHYFYREMTGNRSYEPLVIVDCAGTCCLAYRFSLTTHRRRTDYSHAFEGTGSEVGTELLGYFGGIFEHGLANLETEELAELCRDHERLPMDQMADYDVCDYWSLLNDPSAFCPCTRVECTCTDPDQDCYACGP
jgi:hypothetical protein